MSIQIDIVTVAQLHAQLQALVDSGHGDLPVCATDCRARYPFTAYTINNQAGYLDSLLIRVIPYAQFAAPAETWKAAQVVAWNAEAASVAAGCGPFAE